MLTTKSAMKWIILILTTALMQIEIIRTESRNLWVL